MTTNHSAKAAFGAAGFTVAWQMLLLMLATVALLAAGSVVMLLLGTSMVEVWAFDRAVLHSGLLRYGAAVCLFGLAAYCHSDDQPRGAAVLISLGGAIVILP